MFIAGTRPMCPLVRIECQLQRRPGCRQALWSTIVRRAARPTTARLLSYALRSCTDASAWRGSRRFILEPQSLPLRISWTATAITITAPKSHQD